jgi:hypothetical protein
MGFLNRLMGKKEARPNREELCYTADLYFHPDRFSYDSMTVEHEGQDGTIRITYTRKVAKGKP